MAGVRSLSVAVSTGRVSTVYFIGKEVVGWKQSRTAAKNTQNAARITQAWVRGFKPDIMLCEQSQTASCKGLHAQTVLETIATVFENADGLDIRLPRIQSYQNKYVEAKALAAKYPALADLCPEQPPIWLPEPRNMGYFEALALFDALHN